LNGDSSKQVKIFLSEEIDSMKALKKLIAKEFGLKPKTESRLFGPKGVEMIGNDYLFMKSNEEYYYSPKGRSLITNRG